MGMDLYTTAQGPESENPPVQLLQQEAYRRSLCQVRGGFRPHGVVHARRYPGEIRHDPASPSVRTSTATISHRKKNTGRYSTPNSTSTSRKTLRKRARPNTTPSRRQWKNSTFLVTQLISCNSIRSAERRTGALSAS